MSMVSHGVRSRRLLPVALAALVTLALAAVGAWLRPPTQPSGPPAVLAGGPLWGACSAGFHARRGTQVVVTTSGHCTAEGTPALGPHGTSLGVFGPPARSTTCPVEGKTCAGSDMSYLVLAADRIPWGRLDQVDMGEGGIVRVETGALGCEDVHAGDDVEINGQHGFRTGLVVEKGVNRFPEDGMFFPCMIAADIDVGVGDSGGAVLVRGRPAGVVSRSFGGLLGFTPLAEGLAELGLVLCTDPDCGLRPPAGESP